MSFKCDKCYITQPNGIKPKIVVVETRNKQYPIRYAKDEKTIIDHGGFGHEIVREIRLCQNCAPENRLDMSKT